MYLRIFPYSEKILARVVNCNQVTLEEGEPVTKRDLAMKVVAMFPEAERGCPYSRAMRGGRALLTPWLLSFGL